MTHIKNVFKNEKGILDLASIITGVIITGILAAIVTVSFVVVIPWFQNNTAEDTIANVRIAETSARQDLGVYQTYPDLLTSHYMVASDNKACIILTNSSKNYELYVKSGSAAIFRYLSTTEITSTLAMASVPAACQTAIT